MQARPRARPSSLWAGLDCWGRVGGNSLFVAFIDSESVAIAILWRISTPTVGVNSLGLMIIMCPQHVQHNATGDRGVAILGHKVMCAVAFTFKIAVQL